jgi:hypothetical protein
MKEQRIAVLTYHKYPAEDWPEQEYRTQPVRLVNGEQVSLQLAERGIRLSNDLWVRQVRQRSESGVAPLSHFCIECLVPCVVVSGRRRQCPLVTHCPPMWR